MSEKSISKMMNMYCAPLFLQNAFLAEGHNAESVNATATFVRRKGHLYIVTCRHVKEHMAKNESWSANIHGNRVLIPLNTWSEAGAVSTLQDIDDLGGTDICISYFSEYHLELVSGSKPKKPINLDKYLEPNWKDINLCCAVGFPDKEKSEIETNVASSMIEVTAELVSPINPKNPMFALQSKLPQPSRYGFSGISGGPIFCVENDRLMPIGITFEGAPSGRPIASSGDSFLQPEDIMVRGYTLTPEIFDEWLYSAGLTD
ncbi:hypothetical protein [Palleronia pelagia]|uniref:Trypsin-like peptidase domain-containing protein n=1 Tax=Palleronia pelagia TaxID=387096 RepID=A0A1H8C264_9RHOB|nr:hypothetical protein [Palleronia pelagia]SEM89153.1 hypothetical protein SAMN04488011_101835 [Palleronia pelagia]